MRRWLGGQGLIVMLHEVQDDPAAELNTGCPPETLDWMIRWLRAEGWDFVSMDEARQRLASGRRGDGRFVTLTFDDGFRDTMTHALPVLERHQVPLTCYVPTAAVNREMYSWWLGLRALFLRHDAVEIEALGKRFDCPDAVRKREALSEASWWVHFDYRRKHALRPTFARYGICLRGLNERYFLQEEELRRFAQHPLVTIGGHTTSHAAVAVLEEDAAAGEIAENRTYLQNLLDSPVEHFAYPYGDPRACGTRDAGLAELAGYRTAVATVDGPVSGESPHMYLLPRVAAPIEIDPVAFDGRVSGVYRHGADLLRKLGVMG
ncbi:polysaccharide deacetylase family protein [Siccirubricoccus sp. KC 17139]|uniref:Chitooligosaccharide deacetylase n=2 Tax=Siccirubricoccus soli TaxID=2899147 RepID=A0ABT1D7C6_9PROT|nr:polysaccharide deacetylase family protein [Siccirubricoccus soli]MCP2683967.1 polysaccharide deacetylase family protein [Siccirubricoccus soli]